MVEGVPAFDPAQQRQLHAVVQQVDHVVVGLSGIALAGGRDGPAPVLGKEVSGPYKHGADAESDGGDHYNPHRPHLQVKR